MNLKYIIAGSSAFLFLVPMFANAQMLGGEDRWWRDDESSEEVPSDEDEREEESVEDEEEIDDDDRNDRRRYSSSLRRKIDRLDDDRVNEFSIPILFGLTLDEIWPDFGTPRGGGTRSHEGQDMLAPLGTPIVSPTEAVVIHEGRWEGAGLFVVTANPGGEEFSYLHLDEIADIEQGDVLEVGDLIGYVGDTGNAKGGPAHLHFEIERGGRARDPYPRLGEAFSLKEKMEFVDRILDDHDDKAEYAEFLVGNFQGEFLRARAGDFELSRYVERALAKLPKAGELGSRILELGDEGEDVRVLQTILISQGYLDIDTPTTYFGPLTMAAVRAYQADHGIQTTGNFGPLTRASLMGASGTTTTRSTVTTAVDTELVQLIKLFIALEIIPKEKEALALSALEELGK